MKISLYNQIGWNNKKNIWVERYLNAGIKYLRVFPQCFAEHGSKAEYVCDDLSQKQIYSANQIQKPVLGNFLCDCKETKMYY